MFFCRIAIDSKMSMKVSNVDFSKQTAKHELTSNTCASSEIPYQPVPLKTKDSPEGTTKALTVDSVSMKDT